MMMLFKIKSEVPAAILVYLHKMDLRIDLKSMINTYFFEVFSILRSLLVNTSDVLVDVKWSRGGCSR